MLAKKNGMRYSGVKKAVLIEKLSAIYGSNTQSKKVTETKTAETEKSGMPKKINNLSLKELSKGSYEGFKNGKHFCFVKKDNAGRWSVIFEASKSNGLTYESMIYTLESNSH